MEIARISFVPARLRWQDLRLACVRRIGFQLLPLLEVLAVLLPTLAKLLSLGGIHRLESQLAIFSLGQLIELRGHRDVPSVGCLSLRGECCLRRPVAWRPGVLIVA